jgi:tetratricopeptide (TPR) repeat protein
MNENRLEIALNYLTLGRVALYLTNLKEGDSPSIETQTAREHFDKAVDGFHRAGQQDEVPKGLLSCAWLRSLEGDAEGARADLDEAWEIAERGPMKLHMADIHLHHARLFKDKEELKKAREIIEQCGYWRRKEELEDAEEAAKSW